MNCMGLFEVGTEGYFRVCRLGAYESTSYLEGLRRGTLRLLKEWGRD